MFDNNLQLSKIILRKNQLERLEDNLFSKLQSLNYVDLGENMLIKIPATFPATITQLYLADNRLEQIQFKLANLQHLNLCQNNISVVDFNNLGSTKLRSLCIGDKALLHKSFKGTIGIILLYTIIPCLNLIYFIQGLVP